MKYRQVVKLKNGKEALLRNGDAMDGQTVYDVFNLAHMESDYLLSYPEENSYTPEKEAEFLQLKTESDNEIEIVAVVDEKVIGVAGIEAVGTKYKVKHRAEFGISVLNDYCGLGLGEALLRACIDGCRCAVRYKNGLCPAVWFLLQLLPQSRKAALFRFV